MRPPKPGERIELVAMPQDPHPIPVGTNGTVNFVREHKTGNSVWLQIDVAWDNGRQLMLVVPPD